MSKYNNDDLQRVIEQYKNDKLFSKSLFISFLNIIYQDTFTKHICTQTEDLSTEASLFDFMLRRKDQEIKLNVYHSNQDNEGSVGNLSIEILMDECHFIVKSIMERLSLHNIRVLQLKHPVFAVNRDRDGGLTKIYVPVEKDTVCKETLIYLQVHFVLDDVSQMSSYIKKLRDELYSVLYDVQTVVVDWNPMLSMLSDCPSWVTKNIDLQLYADLTETNHFLAWLERDNFTFLGYAELDQSYKTKNKLGLLAKHQEIEQVFVDIAKYYMTSVDIDNSGMIITKLNCRSPVHKHVHMDMIILYKPISDNTYIVRSFIGLFTSGLQYQSIMSIPVIRKKIKAVIEKKQLEHITGHTKNEIFSLFESFPREELFQVDVNELYKSAENIYNSDRDQVRLLVHQGVSKYFINCIVVIPTARLERSLSNIVQEILCNAFTAEIDRDQMLLNDYKVARYHVLLKSSKEINIHNIDIAKIEKKLDSVSQIWDDLLKQCLIDRYGEYEGSVLSRMYEKVFPVSYTNRFTPKQSAYYDIPEIELSFKAGHPIFKLYSPGDNTKGKHLKIYSPSQEIALSNIIPILENMGFLADSSHVYSVSCEKHNKQMYIYYFRLNINPVIGEISVSDHAKIEDAFLPIWNKKIQDNIFNSLIVSAQLTWHDVKFLYAYSKYLRQIGFVYTDVYMAQVFMNHAHICKLIVELFHTRFNPDLQDQKREASMEGIITKIREHLQDVVNPAEDIVIQKYIDLIMATVRTNYYQHDSKGGIKDYISFKILPGTISGMPKPVPYAEIFVYSMHMEGVHLRGGKVARGGLRWSDRVEDFRTEVLGLVKAQMIKNCVIVPLGSKGGFVLKHPSSDREILLKEGKEAYRTFLRGLLDITDNLENDQVVYPERCIMYDDSDPYLVVAADKGTATFSDLANSISEEYNFWLGDAFASGGSDGYDHKKMGITAKGTWVIIERHFYELGLDVHKNKFTALAIGDMSGDVFGNGMLHTSSLALVAAFNHMHIFIDPNPDLSISYQERKRLFDLPRSSWTDYNAELISKGGGIFSRQAKVIELSPEIKKLLEIEQDSITPDELIRCILMAKVDLFFNGGIGTYIKSDAESHESVGDKNNDHIRVNGNEVNCKVIGEGGNLGMTQLGRIECALRGVKVNTDSIDNAAGVNCSDREVNIKIVFAHSMAKRKLSLKQRNLLLEKMTDTVSQLVLRDNKQQSLALSLELMNKQELLVWHERLMQQLEQDNILDRKLERLPSKEEINRREGILSPELSVLIAYAKNSIYDMVLNSKLVDDKYFEKDLKKYFPQEMSQEFSKDITSHPLRRNIIGTYITNSMVNRMGSIFAKLAEDDTGLSGCDIVRSYVVCRDAFYLREIWDNLDDLMYDIPSDLQLEIFIDIRKFAYKVTFWFLRNVRQPMDVTEMVEQFGVGIKSLLQNKKSILVGNALEHYNYRIKNYLDKGLPKDLADKVASLMALSSACDIVKVANRTGVEITVVGKIHCELETRFKFFWLRAEINKQNTKGFWQRLAVNNLKDEMYDLHRRLTLDVLDCCQNKDYPNAIKYWNEVNKRQIMHYDLFIEELEAHHDITLEMLLVASKRIQILFRNAKM